MSTILEVSYTGRAIPEVAKQAPFRPVLPVAGSTTGSLGNPSVRGSTIVAFEEVYTKGSLSSK